VKRSLADRETVLGVALLAPALAYVLLLVGVPFVLAIALSFSTATAGSLSFNWVGLHNYSVILRDPIFLRSLLNTAIVTIGSQVLVIGLATAAAQVFRAAFRGKRAARFVLLLPWAVPVSLAAIAWTWIFDSTFSVINWTLKVTGLLHGWLYWLGEPGLALFAIIIVQAWRIFPFATVIVLAGLSSIPQDVVEASIVDGAGFWRRLFKVELPLLLPVIAVAVLFGVVYTATDLGVVYILTGGGPANTTHVLPTLAFQRGVLGADLGQGAAIAVFLVPFLIVVAVLMLRVAHRSEVGGGSGGGGGGTR
jgi:multiple sugar transport system permease protein